MLTFLVTLKSRDGSRVLSVRANDEWEARQAALQRNARERGPAMWCDHVDAGTPT